MAGTNPDFDASDFRDQVRSVMVAAEPIPVDLKTTFYWNPQRTFPHADPGGIPYDLTASKLTETDHPPVRIPVAITYAGATAEESESIGQIDTTKATLTICDTDYATVQDADYVTIGGDRYEIDGSDIYPLFDFAVWNMRVHAEGRG